MVRRRLTSSEREIRQSRGIPLSRLLPFALPIIVILAIRLDTQFLQQCVVGMFERSGRGAIGSMIVALARNSEMGRFAVAIACSPSYLLDFSHHGIAVATFWLGVILGVPQIFWLKRHNDYWDAVRQKERADRAAKKAAKEGLGSE